jgi:FHA domain
VGGSFLTTPTIWSVTMPIPTNRDIGQWLITDEPTDLRVWGTDIVQPLSLQPAMNRELTIGAAVDCWFQVQDPRGRVSRQHAKLTYDDSSNRWMIADLRSKNGITQDGIPQVTFALTPGVELGIGGATLIVESPLLVGLRELLALLIGWPDEHRTAEDIDERRAAVDRALRSVRMAATRRESLQLCGDDDQTLVSVARLLHRHTLGDDQPFVICARRPRDADPAVWAHYDGVARYDSGTEALAAAEGGTLCVWPRQPHDFAQVVEAHRNPSSRVQLIVCTRTQQPDPLIAPIVLPSLTERASEIDRIIDAYAINAGAVLGETLTTSDREWIRRHESRTLAQIEKATRRFTAMRTHGITRAADLLGLSHSALSEWLARRTLDIAVDGDNDPDGELQP